MACQCIWTLPRYRVLKSVLKGHGMWWSSAGCSGLELFRCVEKHQCVHSLKLFLDVQNDPLHNAPAVPRREERENIALDIMTVLDMVPGDIYMHLCFDVLDTASPIPSFGWGEMLPFCSPCLVIFLSFSNQILMLRESKMPAAGDILLASTPGCKKINVHFHMLLPVLSVLSVSVCVREKTHYTVLYTCMRVNLIWLWGANCLRPVCIDQDVET